MCLFVCVIQACVYARECGSWSVILLGKRTFQTGVWGGFAFLLHVEKVGRKLVDYENMNTYLRSDPTTSSDPGIEDQSAADADDADDDMNKDT